MHTIVASTLAQAHERAVKTIVEKGLIRITEDGKPTIESESIVIQVNEPHATNRCSPSNRVRPRMCDEYARQLLEGTEAVFEYDYHTRLHAHAPGPVDQVAYMVEKLRAAPTSRRAVAVTWEPGVDIHAVDVPCLQMVKCQVWQERLEMTVVFRSNDICNALGANMFALTALQQAIAHDLGIPAGPYVHIALSPHVYLSDIDDIARFCQNSMEAIRPQVGVCDRCPAEGCRKRRVVVTGKQA